MIATFREKIKCSTFRMVRCHQRRARGSYHPHIDPPKDDDTIVSSWNKEIIGKVGLTVGNP